MNNDLKALGAHVITELRKQEQADATVFVIKIASTILSSIALGMADKKDQDKLVRLVGESIKEEVQMVLDLVQGLTGEQANG